MHLQQFSTITATVDENGIAVCTFNRPEVRNALSQQMVAEIHTLLDELTADGTTRVLIFTGSSGTFVSGADLAEMVSRDRSAALRKINNGLFQKIEDFPTPTIAAIEGYALGGGCELAAACDLRVAHKDARFGQPEVKLGIIPGAGATYRLPRLIGLAKAKELIYTGKIITAEIALEIGLINEITDANPLEAAIVMAKQIAENSGPAVNFAKMALNNASEMSTATGIALETAIQSVLYEDDEKYRRMQEFLDRKKNK
ncbi:MAG: enoyl-CoA hydratase/isomerase family protein [Rhodothermales bacterium]|nr:enoyl-CoA hydratase/isomerase family protein [Rhodothermales bacterium]